MAKGNEYGFVVKLGLDDSDAVGALKDMDKELSKAETAYKNIEKAIQKVEATGGDTTDLMVQKQEQLNNILVITSERLIQLEQLQTAVNQAAESSPDWTTTDTTNYTAALSDARQNVAMLEEALKKLKGEQDENSDSVDTLGRMHDALAKTMEADQSRMEALKSSMEAGKATTEDYSEYMKLLSDKINDVSHHYDTLIGLQDMVDRAFRDGTLPIEEYEKFQNEIKFTADSLKGLQEEYKQNSEEVKSLGETIDDLSLDNLMRNLDTVSGYFDTVINKLKALATETARYGDTVDKQSQRLGMTEQAYQEWTYILSQNGANISTLTAGMRTLTNQIGSSGKALKQLGLDADELKKMTGEEQFTAVVTALQGMEDQTKRNTIANKLLGRTYQQLIPLLNQDADTVERLRQKAHDTNQILDGDGVKAAVAYTDAMDTMKKSMQGLKNQLGAEVLPVLTSFIEQLTEIINGVSEEDIKNIANDIADILKRLANGVQEFIDDGGIEEIINTIDWLTSHQQEIADVLSVIANVWVADKVIHFASQLKIIPELIKSIVTVAKGTPAVISALGTTFTSVGAAISTAMSSASAVVGVSCTAMTVSALGAIAAIAEAIIIADELKGIGNAMNDATAKAEESKKKVQNMQNDVSDIKAMNHSLEQYDAAIKKKEELQKAQEDWAERYKKTNTEIAELEEQGFKTKEDMMRLNELKLERDNLDVEYEMYQNQYKRLEGILDDYSKKEIDKMRETKEAVDEIEGLTQEERTHKALKQSTEKQDTQIKNQEDAITNYYKWLKKQRDLHLISEEEYYQQSEEWLKKHNYTESVAWWKHQDEYDKYVQNKEESAQREAEKEKKDAEKALKEQEALYKEGIKKRYEALEWQRDELEDDEYDEGWFIEQLTQLVGELEEGSDLYYEYYDKLKDYQKKVNAQIAKDAKSEADEWNKAADKVSDAVKDKYKKVEKEFEKAKNELMGSLDLMSELDKKEEESAYALRGLVEPIYTAEEQAAMGKKKNAEIQLNSLKDQTKELKEYQRNLEALKNSGISPEHLADIMGMSFDERTKYIDALMDMSEKERKRYYAEYEEYSKLASEIASDTVEDDLKEAEAFEKSAENMLTQTYNDLSEEAKKQGKSTAQAWIDGWKEVMGDTNTLLTQGAVPSVQKTNGQIAYEAAQTYANAIGGTAVMQGNTIVINIDGKEYYRKQITDYNNDITLGGGIVGG